MGGERDRERSVSPLTFTLTALRPSQPPVWTQSLEGESPRSEEPKDTAGKLCLSFLTHGKGQGWREVNRVLWRSTRVLFPRCPSPRVALGASLGAKRSDRHQKNITWARASPGNPLPHSLRIWFTNAFLFVKKRDQEREQGNTDVKPRRTQPRWKSAGIYSLLNPQKVPLATCF